MKLFTRCIVDCVEANTFTHDNRPVNLALVATVEKSLARPLGFLDNHPAIDFVGQDGNDIAEWLFEDKSQRDQQYDILMGLEL